MKTQSQSLNYPSLSEAAEVEQRLTTIRAGRLRTPLVLFHTKYMAHSRIDAGSYFLF